MAGSLASERDQQARISDVNPPRAPEGVRLYVIGDIHGRHDLLCALHSRIGADAVNAAPISKTLIYLGDYVDRGPRSDAVLETLSAGPLPGFGAIHLMGNHEDMMLAFLEGDPSVPWLSNGGLETLASYGIITPGWGWTRADASLLAGKLRAQIPPRHLDFLRGLRISYTAGDYLFVHAGVRPDRPLDAQDSRDMLWIRDRFLNSTVDFGKCVVHGHSISAEPTLAPNRIGIDTGAFYTNRLCCLVLEGCERRFLMT